MRGGQLIGETFPSEQISGSLTTAMQLLERATDLDSPAIEPNAASGLWRRDVNFRVAAAP